MVLSLNLSMVSLPFYRHMEKKMYGQVVSDYDFLIKM